MPGPQPIDIPLPFGGIDESTSFAKQRANMASAGQNVWPNDAVSGRDRISRRSGLAKYLPDQFAASSFQNISSSTVAINEIAGTGDMLSVAGASGSQKARIYGYAAGATQFTSANNLISAQTLGCTDDDNNFYVCAVAANQIQVVKISTAYSEVWNRVAVGPSSPNLCGIAAFDGVVYVYVMPTSGSAGATHGIYRFKAETGEQIGSGPWLTNAGNGLVTVTGLSVAYQMIAATAGVLGVVGSDGTNLVLQRINLGTGFVIGTTNIQAPLANYPCRLITNAGAEFYVLTEVAGAAANKIVKVHWSGSIPTGWPVTIGGTGAKDICYDPIGYQLVVVGSALGGGTDSMRIYNATTGINTSGGQPNSTSAWHAVAADGLGVDTSGVTTGCIRLRRSAASGTDIIRMRVTASPYTVDWTVTSGLGVISDTLWVVCSGLLVTPTPAQMRSTRFTRSVGIVGGKLYRFDTGTPALVASNFCDGSANVVFSALALSPPTAEALPTTTLGRTLYFTDGVGYPTYNVSTNQASTLTATAGELPRDPNANTCRCVESWRGRLLLFGMLNDMHNVFASAQDNPTDFDYAPAEYDPRQAWAAALAPCGRCPDAINGIIPYNDDVAIMLCDSSIWQMSGDPAAGGRWDNLSDVIGGAWGRAWCRDPHGAAYFMSNRGAIYRIAPNSQPVRLSEAIDNGLWDINQTEVIVSMAWNEQYRGIDIWISPIDAEEDTTHYYWDARSDEYRMPTGSWWPIKYANRNHNTVAICVLNGDLPEDRQVVMGSRDGFILTYSADAKTDAGTPIESYIRLGPIQADGFPVLLTDLMFTLGAESGDCTFSVRAGDCLEAAFNATPQVNGQQLAGGRNNSQAIRVKGHALYVDIGSHDEIGEEQLPWSIESIKAVIDVKQSIEALRRRS